MSKINTLITKQIVELLGAQVRVDFVEESKSPPIFGRLYIWDPESHSIVIGTEFDSEKGMVKQLINQILIYNIFKFWLAFRVH